jgi:hypothetical protein
MLTSPSIRDIFLATGRKELSRFKLHFSVDKLAVSDLGVPILLRAAASGDFLIKRTAEARIDNKEDVLAGNLIDDVPKLGMG